MSIPVYMVIVNEEVAENGIWCEEGCAKQRYEDARVEFPYAEVLLVNVLKSEETIWSRTEENKRKRVGV